MPDKKPYSAPQLVQVALNHEQAILSACSTTTTTASQAGGTTGCKAAPGACKHSNSSPGNSAARSS